LSDPTNAYSFGFFIDYSVCLREKFVAVPAAFLLRVLLVLQGEVWFYLFLLKCWHAVSMPGVVVPYIVEQSSFFGCGGGLL